jgi:type I restriction enzyme M protein
LTVTSTVSSYQLPFVEHCIRALRPGGRAAVIVPDNVLFEDGRGRNLRQMLMDRCDLHTILRLPTGIFYAQGVKTNVIFFRKGENTADKTEAVWVYDLRSNMPAFGKTNPTTTEHFADFERAYGMTRTGKAPARTKASAGASAASREPRLPPAMTISTSHGSVTTTGCPRKRSPILMTLPPRLSGTLGLLSRR